MFPHPEVQAGDYLMDRTIGRGNFAVVRRAKHKLAKMKVAIKVVDKRLVDPINMIKIEREIRILQMLSHPNISHPNIIKLYQVMESNHMIYIVMEYASKGEIFDHLKTHGRMTESQARKMFQQIVAALSYCHAHGVVHRDLKLENLLLTSDMVVKVADFGFGNYFKPGEMLKTWCGSPPYAAPELFDGKPYDGRMVDVWSLGVVLYILVCGGFPFPSTPSLDHLKRAVLSCRFEIPFYVQPDCADLLKKMLVRNPTQRLSIPQIMKHRWFLAEMSPETEDLMEHSLTTVNRQDSLPQSLFDQHKASVYHERVMTDLEQIQRKSRAEVELDLHDKRFQSTYALYHLLCDKYRRRSCKSSCSSSSSPIVALSPALNVTPPFAVVLNRSTTVPDQFRSISGNQRPSLPLNGVHEDCDVFKRTAVNLSELPQQPRRGSITMGIANFVPLPSVSAVESVLSDVTQNDIHTDSDNSSADDVPIEPSQRYLQYRRHTVHPSQPSLPQQQQQQPQQLPMGIPLQSNQLFAIEQHAASTNSQFYNSGIVDRSMNDVTTTIPTSVPAPFANHGALFAVPGEFVGSTIDTSMYAQQQQMQSILYGDHNSHWGTTRLMLPPHNFTNQFGAIRGPAPLISQPTIAPSQPYRLPMNHPLFNRISAADDGRRASADVFMPATSTVTTQQHIIQQQQQQASLAMSVMVPSISATLSHNDQNTIGAISDEEMHVEDEQEAARYLKARGNAKRHTVHTLSSCGSPVRDLTVLSRQNSPLMHAHNHGRIGQPGFQPYNTLTSAHRRASADTNVIGMNLAHLQNLHNQALLGGSSSVDQQSLHGSNGSLARMQHEFRHMHTNFNPDGMTPSGLDSITENEMFDISHGNISNQLTGDVVVSSEVSAEQAAFADDTVQSYRLQAQQILELNSILQQQQPAANYKIGCENDEKPTKRFFSRQAISAIVGELKKLLEKLHPKYQVVSESSTNSDGDEMIGGQFDHNVHQFETSQLNDCNDTTDEDGRRLSIESTVGGTKVEIGVQRAKTLTPGGLIELELMLSGGDVGQYDELCSQVQHHLRLQV